MRNSTLNAAVTRVVAAALALLATPCALALSLGEASSQSSLGQPLRVAVPIRPDAGQALTAACVHVIADAAGGSGPPRLLTGRVTIDRAAAEPQLWVTTSRPVNEPVVRLAVQAGCEGTTRRDYVLLLDPPSAGARPSLAQPSVLPQPVAVTAVPRMTHAKAAAVKSVVTVEAVPVPTPVVPTIAAVEPARKPILLSSQGGGSFIAAASAAGLPRASSGQSGLSSADAEPPVAPWWPLAAALLVVAALARWLVPMRRRSAMEPPAWVTPTARTEPNPSVSGRSPASTAGKPGYFAAMTEPGPGFPRGASKAERGAPRTERGAPRTEHSASRAEPTPSKPMPAATSTQSAKEDSRFADFDADLIEEQTIRAEWAKAVTDGAIDMGGDSILKAIDDAERAIQGGPAHPAQVALDRSLDDELLPYKPPR